MRSSIRFGTATHNRANASLKHFGLDDEAGHISDNIEQIWNIVKPKLNQMSADNGITIEGEIITNKNLRKGIDEQIQIVKYLPPSRERSICITKLQEAVMWLGMDLKRLGTPNPYPNSYDPTNTKIEPTADGLTL